MSDLRELYQEVILDHTKKPRNFGRLDGTPHHAAGDNPICGDTLEVYLALDGEVIQDVRFEGKGCAISTASASLMTQAIKGKAVPEVRELFTRFHDAVTSPPDQELDVAELGKLAVLTGVREFPMRVKCASLAWHTMNAALAGEGEVVSTE